MLSRGCVWLFADNKTAQASNVWLSHKPLPSSSVMRNGKLLKLVFYDTAATPWGLLKGEVLLCPSACPVMCGVGPSCGCSPHRWAAYDRWLQRSACDKEIGSTSTRRWRGLQSAQIPYGWPFLVSLQHLMSHLRAGLNHWASRQIDTALTVPQHAWKDRQFLLLNRRWVMRLWFYRWMYIQVFRKLSCCKELLRTLMIFLHPLCNPCSELCHRHISEPLYHIKLWAQPSTPPAGLRSPSPGQRGFSSVVWHLAPDPQWWCQLTALRSQTQLFTSMPHFGSIYWQLGFQYNSSAPVKKKKCSALAGLLDHEYCGFLVFAEGVKLHMCVFRSCLLSCANHKSWSKTISTWKKHLRQPDKR